jgi:phosphate transport system substrate-binding protein
MRLYAIATVAAACAIAALFLGGCGTKNDTTSTEEVLAPIQIKGSDTMINLVQIFSEKFMEKNPNAEISVTGGGSGTGIAALINGKCDIANASREMKQTEITMAEEQGQKVKRVIVARDGLSVIVNENNTIDKLTMEEIGRIFRGEIVNWKDLGGSDVEINMYGRQSSSGTFVFFRELVVRGEYSQDMKGMNGNAQIVEAVGNDESGIGYVGVGYAKGATKIKILKVAASAGGDYASPLVAEDVKSGKYPISRPLNQYIAGEATGTVRKLIEFELSEEGMKIVETEGFFPPTPEDRELTKAAIGF